MFTDQGKQRKCTQDQVCQGTSEEGADKEDAGAKKKII